MVGKLGLKKWCIIATRLEKEFPGTIRSGKQCRERWFNYLEPGIKLGAISREEEDLIMETHKKYGNKWV
jgi:hypothetical protein